MVRYSLTLKALLVIGATFFIKTVDAQSKNYKSVLANCLNQHKILLDKTDCMNGVTAPDFIGSTIDGTNVQLSKLKGQVVVLNFWFISCAPCRAEVPGLNDVVENFKKEKVSFVSIATDSKQMLRNYLAKNKFLFKTIADPAFLICQKKYNISGYPTTVIINKNGKIRFYSTGGKVPQQDKNDNAFFPLANKSNSNCIDKEIRNRLVPVIEACLRSK